MIEVVGIIPHGHGPVTVSLLKQVMVPVNPYQQRMFHAAPNSWNGSVGWVCYVCQRLLVVGADVEFALRLT